MTTVTVTLAGGGPYGFRLVGGEHDPLVIAKIRQHSKSAESGCKEGDILLGVNGYNTKGMNHGTAMGLVENAGDSLQLTLLRGATGQNAINAAFQNLGSRLQSLPASSATQQKTTGGRAQFGTAQTTPASSQAAEVRWDDGGAIRNSRPGYHREEQTFNEGGNTKHVTTETTRENIGGNVVVKTRRQVTQSIGGNSPQASKPSFNVPSSMVKKPGVWSPSGMTVSAPSNVGVQRHSDNSVTMTIGMGGDESKENVSPNISAKKHFEHPKPAAPMFSVKKVATIQPSPGSWKPADTPTAPKKFAPSPPQHPPKQPVREASPEHQEMWNRKPLWDTQDSQFQPKAPRKDPVLKGPIWAPKLEVEEDRSVRQAIPPHLAKILQPAADSDPDSLPGSPGPYFRKIDDSQPSLLISKKIYSDSSFYNDPEKKYPTIEEQIKMARKVALSLTAPQNKRARGHTMFVKQIEKSEKWSTDNPEGIPMLESYDEGDKYYNPNPWNTQGHTWAPKGGPTNFAPMHWDQPASHPSPKGYQPSAPSPASSKPLWERLGTAPTPGAKTNIPSAWEPEPMIGTGGSNIPAPPTPAPVLSFPPINIPKRKKDDNSMTAEEFERVRLFEKKTTHNQLNPQVAFSIADDLRNMKGKGGKLFAKRRERAQQWVVDEQPSESTPSESVMAKIQMQHGPPPGSEPVPTKPEQFGVPSGRLKEMIDPPKPKFTPWDAAVEFGSTEKAFEHLRGYRPYGQDQPKSQFEDVASKLEEVTKKDPLGFGHVNTSSSSAAPKKMPDYTRKIAPWGSDSGSESSAVNNNISRHQYNSMFQTGSFTQPNYNPQIKPWRSLKDTESSSHLTGPAQVSKPDTSGSQTRASGNFRPVKFMAAQGNFSGIHQSGSAGSDAGSSRSSGPAANGPSSRGFRNDFGSQISPTASSSSHHSYHSAHSGSGFGALPSHASREMTAGYCDL